MTELGPAKASRIRSHNVLFPSVFSFIDNPDETLEFFEEFVRMALTRPKKMKFDQSNCQALDMCAVSLLKVLVGDLHESRRVNWGGYLPQKRDLAELVFATGLPRLVGMNYPEIEGYRHHELRRGRKSSLGQKDNDRGRETTSLVTYVDECLGDLGFSLTSDEDELLAELVGEVLDNAERHSSQDHWWIAGYLRRQGNEAADCHIVIFNFGDTIAETLQQLPKGSALRENINRLMKVHRPFFELRKKWTEENLWTLYAMQEGVSRKNESDRAKDVGQGTVDMVEWFQTLAGDDKRDPPVMCLISGSTYIRFDSRYKMRPEDPSDPNSYKVIAFNNDNSIWEPPDERSVSGLSKFFPGTLLSMRFKLTRAHLAEVSVNASH